MANIEVIIKKDTQEGTAPSKDTSVGETPVQSTEGGLTDLQKKALIGAVVQVGQQFIATGVTQFGNITGNYQLARNINAASSILADGFTMAKFGPIGVMYVATKYATNAISSVIEQNNKNIELEVMRQRAGTISTKGSRY
jgi:hypothetical protein